MALVGRSSELDDLTDTVVAATIIRQTNAYDLGAIIILGGRGFSIPIQQIVHPADQIPGVQTSSLFSCFTRLLRRISK